MKSLAKNSVYNLLYKFALLVFPLISSMYVSRILTPSGIGSVSYAQNIVSYFISFAGLGVATYGIREIGKVQNDKSAYTNIFYELFSIVLVSTVLCCLIYFSWLFVVKPFDNILLYVVAGFQLILSVFNVDWFYQGMEEYRYITNRSILIKFSSLIILFVLVRNSDDIISFSLITSLALAGNNIINLIHIRKYIGKPIFSNLRFKIHIRPLLILLSTNLSVELYTKLDTTCLGMFTEMENVAYYNYATKISSIVISLCAALSTILLPRLSYYYENGNMEELKNTVIKAHKAILTIAVPATIGLFVVASDAVTLLFGASFSPATVTIKILSLLVIIKSIGNLYGTQVLLTFGKEKLLLYSTIIGAVTNIIMNLILIPVYQENGAAISSVISEVIVCIVQIRWARKEVNTYIGNKFNVKVGFACVIMYILIEIMKRVIGFVILRLLLICVVGSITYYVVSVIVKNEIVLSIGCKIRKVIRSNSSK